VNRQGNVTLSGEWSPRVMLALCDGYSVFLQLRVIVIINIIKTMSVLHPLRDLVTPLFVILVENGAKNVSFGAP